MSTELNAEKYEWLEGLPKDMVDDALKLEAKREEARLTIRPILRELHQNFDDLLLFNSDFGQMKKTKVKIEEHHNVEHVLRPDDFDSKPYASLIAPIFSEEVKVGKIMPLVNEWAVTEILHEMARQDF